MVKERDIIVFPHMMKTAGTSITKQLIGHFGPRIFISPGGLKWSESFLSSEQLKEIDNADKDLKIITGHTIRPHVNYNISGVSLKWFTFLRSPEDRYLSHYLHDLAWTARFIDKGDGNIKSIVEWERIQKHKNYQTMFLAGEQNLQKAIDILETKFDWIGDADEYSNRLMSLNLIFERGRNEKD